jgi:hypothetical protein
MKYILLMTVLCTGSFYSSAQSGVRFQTGINISNVTRSNGSIDEANMLSSFHAGLVADFQVASSVYFQPGLIYGGKGSKIQSGTPGTNGYYKQTFNPYYIDMPVNLVVKTPSTGAGRFFIGAGPYISIGIRGKTKTEGQTVLGTTYNLSSDLVFSNDDPSTFNEEEGAGFGVIKRFDYGANAVAGFEGKSMVLSVGYGFGLAKISSGTNQSTGDDNKHRVISINLGLKL